MNTHGTEAEKQHAYNERKAGVTITMIARKMRPPRDRGTIAAWIKEIEERMASEEKTSPAELTTGSVTTVDSTTGDARATLPSKSIHKGGLNGTSNGH